MPQGLGEGARLGQHCGSGEVSSYHGGQLGDHVAQRVDVALIPGVGSAQVPGHLAELLGAGSSVGLQEKCTAQGTTTAQNT